MNTNNGSIAIPITHGDADHDRPEDAILDDLRAALDARDALLSRFDRDSQPVGAVYDTIYRLLEEWGDLEFDDAAEWETFDALLGLALKTVRVSGEEKYEEPDEEPTDEVSRKEEEQARACFAFERAARAFVEAHREWWATYEAQREAETGS